MKFFGLEKLFFHLTGTLYGWQPEKLPALFFYLKPAILLPCTLISCSPDNRLPFCGHRAFGIETSFTTHYLPFAAS
jgi:hypothetical protein